jgi:hypothetical protein
MRGGVEHGLVYDLWRQTLGRHLAFGLLREEDVASDHQALYPDENVHRNSAISG